MKLNQPAPDFTLQDSDGNDWTLSQHRGKVVVILFYPADNSPICTTQLCSLRDHWPEYQETQAEVVAISTDSVQSHKRFAHKHRLPVRLLSDAGCKIASLYDMKSWLPGRAARGVVVIGKQGRIAYHNVQTLSFFRPSDDEVLTAIKKATNS